MSDIGKLVGATIESVSGAEEGSSEVEIKTDRGVLVMLMAEKTDLCNAERFMWFSIGGCVCASVLFFYAVVTL